MDSPSTPSPAWTLEVTDQLGRIDTFTGDANGKLTQPTLSNQRVLTRLLGFHHHLFTRGPIPLTFSDYLFTAEAARGMHPIFDTIDDSPTTLFATVAPAH